MTDGLDGVKPRRGTVKEPGVELTTGGPIRPMANRVSPVFSMWVAGYSLPMIREQLGMSCDGLQAALGEVRSELRVHVLDPLEARITLAAYCKAVREFYGYLMFYGSSRRISDKIGCGRLILQAVEVESRLLGLDSITVNHVSSSFEKVVERLAEIKQAALSAPVSGVVVEGEVTELATVADHKAHSANNDEHVLIEDDTG